MLSTSATRTVPSPRPGRAPSRSVRRRSIFATRCLPTWFGGKQREIGQQYVVSLDGWLAEYRVVSEQALVAMPALLTFEEAATLPCTAVTAWTALAGVAPGETVLTQGSGSVSLFAMQLAQTSGA